MIRMHSDVEQLVVHRIYHLPTPLRERLQLLTKNLEG